MRQSTPSRSSKLVATSSSRHRKRVLKHAPPSSSTTLKLKLKHGQRRFSSHTPENAAKGIFSSGNPFRVNRTPNNSTSRLESSISVLAGVTLPRQLARAPFRESRHQALAAVNPDLVHTNIEYVRDCLELRGSEMFKVLKHTSILALNRPHPRFPPVSARVRVANAFGNLPTHVLAVRGGDYDELDEQDGLDEPGPSVVQYTAIHSLALAVYTPQLGALPPSDPSSQLPDSWTPGDDAELTLPVVVLRVPSPATFGLLISALYTQRFDNFVKTLLGIPLISPDSTKPQSKSALFTQSVFSSLLSPLSELPPPRNESDTETEPETDEEDKTGADLAIATAAARLTKRISNASRLVALGYSSGARNPMDTAQALVKRSCLARALAANARALGVCDIGLWGAIDVAWAVLLGAIGVCAGGLSPTALGVAEPLVRMPYTREA